MKSAFLLSAALVTVSFISCAPKSGSNNATEKSVQSAESKNVLFFYDHSLNKTHTAGEKFPVCVYKYLPPGVPSPNDATGATLQQEDLEAVTQFQIYATQTEDGKAQIDIPNEVFPEEHMQVIKDSISSYNPLRIIIGSTAIALTDLSTYALTTYGKSSSEKLINASEVSSKKVASIGGKEFAVLEKALHEMTGEEVKKDDGNRIRCENHDNAVLEYIRPIIN